MKRFLDIIISCTVLLIFLPIIVLAAILIRIKMGSPIIFKQQRPGLHGKPFYLYKFRTMIDEIDKNGRVLDDFERMPKLGTILRKYSIDELPQLINVLKGDMSIVGPRPLLMEYLPLYSKKHVKRHHVRPGITGWAQVNGRNALSWEEKFDLDVWYVENQSFLIDIRILLLTILKVLKSEGVDQNQSTTMEVFKGYKQNRKI